MLASVCLGSLAQAVPRTFTCRNVVVLRELSFDWHRISSPKWRITVAVLGVMILTDQISKASHKEYATLSRADVFFSIPINQEDQKLILFT